MKTVIEMAREAGWDDHHAEFDTRLKRFAELVRADECEKLRDEMWDKAMKLVVEATKFEREACAKVAEDSDHVVGGRGYYDQLGDADATVRNIVAAIRARSNT